MSTPRVQLFFGLAVLLSCGLLLSNLPPQTFRAAAQTCVNPDAHLTGTRAAWAAGVTVTVNLNASQFSPAEVSCLQRGFTNWNSANGASGNASGVTFNVQSTPPPVATVDAQGNVSGGINVFQVNRGTPDMADARGQINRADNGTNAIRAVSIIRPDVTN